MKEFCQRTDNKNELLPLFAYIVVRRHHDDLIDVMDELSLFDSKNLQILHEQLNSIDDTSFSVLCKILYQQGIPVLINKKMLHDWFNGFGDELKQYRKLLRKARDLTRYLTLNLLYSLLLDADKSDVVIGNLNIPERKDYDEKEWIDNYITNLPVTSKINELRNEAYREVNGKIVDSTRQKIYSINLPTGFGKTLTGFSFALKLKNELKKNCINPRIIYSLPFLSIIEQNYHVIEKVLEINRILPNSDVILKHHHLSEIFLQNP